MYKIDVDTRQPRAQSNYSLRKKGLIPAVYYHHNEDSIPLTIKNTDIQKFLKSHNSILNLSNGKMAILKSIDQNIHGEIIHLNLEGVVHGEKFHKTIPLHIVYDEDKAAWKKEGLLLFRKMTEIEIETTPENVPEFLEVRVDELTKGEVLRVKDIQVEGLKIIDDPEQEVAMLTYPHVEQESSSADAETLAEQVPEVGKQDKDEKDS